SARELGLAEDADVARLERLLRPGLLPDQAVDAEETLPREVHAQAGHEDELVAALQLVMAVLGEEEGDEPLEPAVFLRIRIEAGRDEAPALRDPDLVQEGRVHLEAAV